jgi:hypothetical protein
MDCWETVFREVERSTVHKHFYGNWRTRFPKTSTPDELRSEIGLVPFDDRIKGVSHISFWSVRRFVLREAVRAFNNWATYWWRPKS